MDINEIHIIFEECENDNINTRINCNPNIKIYDLLIILSTANENIKEAILKKAKESGIKSKQINKWIKNKKLIDIV